MMRRKPPCINVKLVNDDDTSSASPTASDKPRSKNTCSRYSSRSLVHQSAAYSPLSDTLRTDGLSIGFDYFRFEGFTISSLSPSTLELEGTIGRGACSVVRLARTMAATSSNDNDKDTNSEQNFNSDGVSADRNYQHVALKTSPIRDPARRKMMIKELRVLCRLDCDCLVRLVGAFFDIKHGMVTMVLEYMDRGSLVDLIRLNRDTGLPRPQLASVAFQMLWGLGFLHYENLLHRDIKPANVLINSLGRIKLSDFGISCQQRSDQEGDDMNTTLVGTTRYMSPERLRAKAYGSPSDVWSLGLVLLECATGMSPFHDASSTIDLILTIEETSLDESISTSLDDDVREMISSCLQKNPEERVPAEVLLASPFLSEAGICNADDAALLMKQYYETVPLHLPAS